MMQISRGLGHMNMLVKYNIYLPKVAHLSSNEVNVTIGHIPRLDAALSLRSTSSLGCRAIIKYQRLDTATSIPGIGHPYYVPSSGTQQHKDKPPQVKFSQSAPENLE